jgi:hypothetical protein|tara:strand:+ start:988 stop:1455 length:468 start_codon:yes stop_codon:yes gene_type:complete
MAITRDSTLDLNQIGTRVRLLTGIESTEVDDTDLSELASMAMEWFEDQTGTTYAVDTSNAYDNAVVYYTCYLASIAQNGMGIENLKIGDLFISYTDDEPYQRFEQMALDAIKSYSALSIKMTTYNADSNQGDVNWKKNIDGSDSTLNVRQKPRNL